MPRPTTADRMKQTEHHGRRAPYNLYVEYVRAPKFRKEAHPGREARP